jgi:hypothetical protein
MHHTKEKLALLSIVSLVTFNRIMSFSLPKEICNYLHEEFTKDVHLKGMKVLNLIREFELSHMKEVETIKGYSNSLLLFANKV